MGPPNRNFRSTRVLHSSPYNLRHRRPRSKPETPPPLVLRRPEGVGTLPATHDEVHFTIKQESPCLPESPCRPEGVGILPATPEAHFTIKQEDPPSPVLSQHPASTLPWPLPPQEELVPSLEEALRSPLVPQLQTPLADPVTGRIILDAVSLEMRPFAVTYNHILDILDEVSAIAEYALANRSEIAQ